MSVQPKNLLRKTNTVVIGAMQYGDGRSVRETFSNLLSPIGITVWDHYRKPFLTEFDESPETHKKLKKLLEDEKFDEIIKYSDIRIYDLSLIDRADFIIFVYDPDVVTCGSWEEFFWANRVKKPCFFINIKGRKKTPLWCWWVLKNPNYFYDSIEDCVEMIKKIDSGEVKMDSKRWKLLRAEYR